MSHWQLICPQNGITLRHTNSTCGCAISLVVVNCFHCTFSRLNLHCNAMLLTLIESANIFEKQKYKPVQEPCSRPCITWIQGIQLQTWMPTFCNFGFFYRTFTAHNFLQKNWTLLHNHYITCLVWRSNIPNHSDVGGISNFWSPN